MWGQHAHLSQKLHDLLVATITNAAFAHPQPDSGDVVGAGARTSAT